MNDIQADGFLLRREKVPIEPPAIQYDQTLRPAWDELSPAERLILWSIRALAETLNNWPQVQKELWLCCGPVTIETVLQALHEMLTILAVHHRRKLNVRKLGNPRLSADEVTVLTLIAAAQDGQFYKLEAIASWLVCDKGHDAVKAAACQFAEGLSRSGIELASLGRRAE